MLNNHWQLQEAKSKFSNLVDKAKKSGPQVVTKHGEEAVVVLSMDEYRKLLKPELNLVDFLRKSPLAGQDLELERAKDFPRDIEL